MNYKVIIGCDIAKQKLDFYCSLNKESFTLSNNQEGYQKFFNWLTQHQFSSKELAIVVEHTGSYGVMFEKFCFSNQLPYFKVPALEIKLSTGIKRGKSDSIDAKMIATYFIEKGYKLKPTMPITPTTERIKLLRSTRDFLVKQLASTKVTLKNYSEVLHLDTNDEIIKILTQNIKLFTQQIGELEKQILELLDKNKPMKKNYKLLISVPGIGKVIAIDTIIATDNFTKFNDWRKYASYCGCAPFPNESGTFIGRKRISNMAAKSLKANLTSGAKSAMFYDQETKIYTLKKLEQGKHKKCITNAVRCKLIARMFSVVRNQTEYVKNYSHYLAVS